MKLIIVFFTLCLLIISNNISAYEWLTENYDIHLTCKLEKECSPGYDCAYFHDGYSQTLHFSLGADLNNWRNYRTCNYNSSLDISGRLPRDCHSDWEDDKSDGMWVCYEGSNCKKIIVKSISSNNLYAIQNGDLFNLEVNEYNGTLKGKYGLLPAGNPIEYFIDRTRGTLTMKFLKSCGSEKCGVYLKDGRTFPLHREQSTQFFSCQPIQRKLF